MDEWQALIRKGKMEQPAAAAPRPARRPVPQAPEPLPPDPVWDDAPAVPRNIGDTGIAESYVIDLVLKTLNLRGTLLGHEICNEIKLPYSGVLQDVLTHLKEER